MNLSIYVPSPMMLDTEFEDNHNRFIEKTDNVPVLTHGGRRTKTEQ